MGATKELDKSEDMTLSDMLKSVIGENERFSQSLKVYQSWPLIVGAELSAVTAIKSIKNNVLTVKTTSSSAKNIVIMRKKEIMDSLNESFPFLDIKNIKVTTRY